MLNINKQLEGQLNIKRFYLEGAEISYVCPNCGEEYKYDQYLFYPEVNKFISLGFHCYECEHEWTEEIKLNINIETK